MDSLLIVSLKRQKSLYNSKIKVLSPAKINLYLNITGRYPNGFHRIESIFERVSFFDEITIEIVKKPEIQILSNCKDLETNSNLCYKAAHLLWQKAKLPFGFKIFLNKRIPVGSGLGGGSSNAASTLIGIDQLLSLKLSKEELYCLGAKLGSDVNFFLSRKSFAFVYGRGEKVVPFKGSQLYHDIVWPRINLSTRKVYENTRVKLTKFLSNVNIVKYAIIKQDVKLLRKNIFNVLERGALTLCTRLETVKRLLNEKGIFSKVTGSGSAFYTVIEKEAARNKIDRFLPKEWLRCRVQTF
jgi:4-diphosphocytidyl-2-C-methyl-D-erythritol kinase